MKRIFGTPPRLNKKITIVSCLAILFALAFLFLFIRERYPQRILDRFLPSRQSAGVQPVHNERALDAWENCLKQARLDADVVFFGDSLTRRGGFDRYFPEKTVCNLGLGSDTIAGMTERVSMIAAVSPETVFVMGGINSLRDDTLDRSVKEYDALMSRIADSCPASVYVVSVLPISKEKASELGCSPDTIVRFNEAIEASATRCGFLYIDLYRDFATDGGYMTGELTTDGVHLTEEGYTLWTAAISGLLN